ncbi:unnamed protein product [Calypogeia fissa]
MATLVGAPSCGCVAPTAATPTATSKLSSSSSSCSSFSSSPTSVSVSVSGRSFSSSNWTQRRACTQSISRALILQTAFTSPTWSSRFFDGGVGRLVLSDAVAGAAAAWGGDGESGCGHGGGGALSAQANIFERVVRIVKSYANAIVSAAEDPEKLLDQTVLEMSEDLTKMRQASAQVLASQKQLENKQKASQQTSDDWYRRAKLALEKGDETLAKEALKRRKDYEDSARALKAQLDQQKGVVEKLVSNTRLLEGKIQEAKSKKDTLKARAQSAKTSQKVNEMLGNIKTSSALAAFDKMEEKVTALEAEADALNQLSTDDLAGKFALLEGESVDDDLAALKRDMLGGPKRSGELPEGRSASTVSSGSPFKDFEIERELNELRKKANEY